MKVVKLSQLLLARAVVSVNISAATESLENKCKCARSACCIAPTQVASQCVISSVVFKEWPQSRHHVVLEALTGTRDTSLRIGTGYGWESMISNWKQ